jgi:hypothetical protein
MTFMSVTVATGQQAHNSGDWTASTVATGQQAHPDCIYSLCVYIVWNAFTVFGGWIYRAVLATPCDGERLVFIVTRVLIVVSWNLSYSQHLGAEVNISVVDIVEPAFMVQFAVRYARACCHLHTKYRTHCMPLYGTFETVALCRGAGTKFIIYGNRAEAELDSKCSARLSLHTYFGVRQPLIASFADPKKGKYPVVDA